LVVCEQAIEPRALEGDEIGEKQRARVGGKNGGRLKMILLAVYIRNFHRDPVPAPACLLDVYLLHAQCVDALNLPAESSRRRSVEDKDGRHCSKLNQTEFERNTYIQTPFSPNFIAKLQNLPKRKL